MREVLGRQLVRYDYFRRDRGFGLDGDTAQVVSGERNARSVCANSCLCNGVKFRWREGFDRSASHASAHNSSVDVAGEVSGGIGFVAIGTILAERPVDFGAIIQLSDE